MIIYKIENTYSAQIIKRPSKICKTPYVADIIIENKNKEDKTEYLAHTAALGCCGMVDKDKSVIVSDSVNKTNKCKYKILLAKVNEKNNINVIGVDPKIAEYLVETCLKNNLLSTLVGTHFIREKTIMNSRFDFVGFDKNGILFIMEVKNVPLADYVDCYKKDRKHMNFDDKDVNSKIAYFPDGYRKNQKDTVSPRALKHITELTKIKMKNKNKVRTIMCYVIQREDASSFQPSNVDPIYKEAFNKALFNGVEIITLQIGWSVDGCAKFIRDDLPINM